MHQKNGRMMARNSRSHWAPPRITKASSDPPRIQGTFFSEDFGFCSRSSSTWIAAFSPPTSVPAFSVATTAACSSDSSDSLSGTQSSGGCLRRSNGALVAIRNKLRILHPCHRHHRGRRAVQKGFSVSAGETGGWGVNHPPDFHPGFGLWGGRSGRSYEPGAVPRVRKVGTPGLSVGGWVWWDHHHPRNGLPGMQQCREIDSVWAREVA